MEETADKFYEKGVREFSVENYAEAVKYWKECLILNPQHIKAKKGLERAKREQQRFGTANDDLMVPGRRDVLGAAYVDNSVASASAFMVDFQKLVTEYCWGEIWTRPGIDRRTRSVLNLGMLIALNRTNELRLHVRGALNNGLTRDEIKELLLQSCIYCGIPAGLEAFKVAEEVFKAIDAEAARA